MHTKSLGAAGTALAIFLGVMSHEAVAAGEAPQDRWVINTGEHGERDRLTSYPAWLRLVENLASKARISSSFMFSLDSTTDMVATRNGTVAMIVGPAHMVSSALRHGHYLPVGATSRNVRVVLATLKGSSIHNFADVKGKSLGVPGQDAIATYLMRGEANAAGSSIRQYFSRIYYTYYEGALLNALKFGTVDVAAVEEKLFEQWRAKNEPVQEVMRTQELPGIAIVAHKALGKGAIDTMREQLAGKAVPSQPGATFRSIEPAAYSYVSTLGYFTPRQLEGTQVVGAQEVRQLMARGVPLYDTRVRPEHVVSRPAGALWLPYTERSAKETDFDPAVDQFDLTKLPGDKNKELIFACGGPECWKSYKAAVLAVRAGHKRIYWFRGGMTDWMEAGLPIDKG